jgi:hypothetical protein
MRILGAIGTGTLDEIRPGCEEGMARVFAVMVQNLLS